MRHDAEKVLIIGIGNELLGDEGLGVHVARSLLDLETLLLPEVEVYEAGTALFDALLEMRHCARLVLVDAIRAGQAAGTVYRAELIPELVDELEALPLVSLHEWGVAETLQAAKTLGLLPGRLTLLGAEPERVTPGTELSPRVARAAEEIVSLLRAEFGVGAQHTLRR